MKERIKTITIIILIVMVISISGVYAATIISSINVEYNNENSKLVADNVQDAIDEVYKKASESKAPQPKNENIKAMYYYDENKESKDFCVTGDEKTCKVNTCYLNNTEGSCSPGTIVEYMVNEQDKIRFHVVHDDGSTLTLQSQKNTLNSVKWYDGENSDQGTVTALTILENTTSNWMNVNTLDYSISDDTSSLGYSGCDYEFGINCNNVQYKLENKTGKSRMITVQETSTVGCNNHHKSCPIWMYNYLNSSTNYGGTKNEDSATGYWTLNVLNSSTNHILIAHQNGNIGYVVKNMEYGARAVVEITKS